MTALALPTTFPSLRDKVVFLTGGSSGIGLATAELFSSQGAHILLADLHPPPIPLAHTTHICTDVSSWPSLLAAFAEAQALYPGGIDILIANAGVGEVDDAFADTWSPVTGELLEPSYKTIDVNLKGVFNCVKLAVSYWRRTQRGGRIICTSSTAGYMGEVGIPIYTAAKHGVVGLMRSTAPTFADEGIQISCVAPWFTESGLIYGELRNALVKAGLPVQKPVSVARAMAFAATAEHEEVRDACGPAAHFLASAAAEGETSLPWTNKTIYVSNDTHTELESALIAAEPQWLGVENSAAFRQAQSHAYFVH